MENANKPQLTPLLVHLLKGVLYRDTHHLLWQQLAQIEPQVRDYISVLGLELLVDQGEGYAFLRQKQFDAMDKEVPRLVQRRPLSYPVSLLCVLLRKRLTEADHAGENVKAIITRDDIQNDIQTYLKPQANEARQVEQIDATIKKVIDLGFLKPIKEEGYFEIRRIIKALVDADWLADLNEKLQTYREHAHELQ